MSKTVFKSKYWLGGLNLGTLDSLRAYFDCFGDLEEVLVKEGKGFAFLTFVTHSPQESADLSENILNASHQIDGNFITAQVAIPKGQVSAATPFVYCPECGHCFQASNQ